MDRPRPKGNVTSGVSVALGIAGLVWAGICCRWTLFILAIDLGDNDFAGCFYLLVEGALLVISGTLTLACLVFATAALFMETPKLLARIGAGVGIMNLAVLVYGFLKPLH